MRQIDDGKAPAFSAAVAIIRGILCLAIVGGAILPVIRGGLADTIGIHPVVLMPIICYVHIAFYGLKSHKPA